MVHRYFNTRHSLNSYEMLDDAVFARCGFPRVYNGTPINGGTFTNASIDVYDPSRALRESGYTTLPDLVMLNFERIPNWTGATKWLTKTITAIHQINPRAKIGLYDNRDGDLYRYLFDISFPSASISDGVDPWPLQNSFYEQWLKLRFKTCIGQSAYPVIHPMEIPKDNIVRILSLLAARNISQICLWSWCADAVQEEKSKQIYNAIEVYWNKLVAARGTTQNVQMVNPGTINVSNNV